MQGKTIINIEKPQTQTLESVKSLLAWRGWASDPLSSFIEMGEGEGKVVLVLSNKKDSYYTTTARECSCPAHNWHPNQQCKHQRRYFPEETAATKSPAAIRQPNHGAWHGRNGPIIEDEVRPIETAKISSIPLVDTLGEPTPAELAYQSISEDREMWPMAEA